MAEEFMSGFIAIIGRPNVGKSTLMNRMIGEKIAIVSNKPQTTRNQIQGVLTKDQYQMIFIDTPGIQKPKNKLGEYMAQAAYNALEEVDAVLMVVDAAGGIGHGDKSILKELEGIKTPVILAVNKIDALDEEKLLITLNEFASMHYLSDVVPVSALEGIGLDELEKTISKHLQPGPKYFPDDMITDQPERVIVAEIIREKALELLKDEVPHGIGVEITDLRKREEKDMIDIQATIYCEKSSHKGIVIGKQGRMLKEIGQKSREDIQNLFGSPIYLELWVKVKTDWRNSVATMRTLGYE